MKNGFDIIIPTYNNIDELKACLNGLENQNFTSFRVFVCIDGSTDGTKAFLNEYTPQYELTVLEHADKKNHGRNPTRNLAVSLLSSEYVLLLDSDLVPQPDLLQTHNTLLKNKECISVGQVIYLNSAQNLWAMYQSKRGKNQFSNGQKLPFKYFGIQNAAMRTITLMEIGGFDEKMIHYGGNDNELSYRLNQRYMLEFIFNRQAVAEGEMNKELIQALLQLYEFGQINLHYLLNKYPDYHDMFKTDVILRQNSFNQLFWSKGFARLLLKIVTRFSSRLLLPMIHYLTAFSIRSGYFKDEEYRVILRKYLA